MCQSNVCVSFSVHMRETLLCLFDDALAYVGGILWLLLLFVDRCILTLSISSVSWRIDGVFVCGNIDTVFDTVPWCRDYWRDIRYVCYLYWLTWWLMACSCDDDDWCVHYDGVGIRVEHCPNSAYRLGVVSVMTWYSMTHYWRLGPVVIRYWWCGNYCIRWHSDSVVILLCCDDVAKWLFGVFVLYCLKCIFPLLLIFYLNGGGWLSADLAHSVFICVYSWSILKYLLFKTM